MSFAKSLMEYYQNLEAPIKLPREIEVMNPYQSKETFRLAATFYHKFYDDSNARIICFGINPGRFGAGLTGVPFTDPIRLEEDCGIPNDFDKKPELSTRFIYEMIHAYGGPKAFYSKFYISGVSPLGYLKDGVNINYYDLKGYKQLFEKYAVEQIVAQLKLNIRTDIAFSIGKGKNIEFLNWINKKHGFFKEILPLPHPRWVMQYRLKRKEEFVQEYVAAFEGL